jgi:hypothetical protein
MIPDGECPNDDAEMDSEEHSMASQNKGQDFGGTVAEELTEAVPEKATTANTASSSVAAKHEESIQSIGKMIQDLFRSDYAKIDAALYALNLDLVEDENKSDKIQAVGGCHALVQLLKNCIGRAVYEFPAYDQVTELNELAELTIIYNTLVVIMRLTFQRHGSIIGITAVGGVEVVVKVMKTFPKCQALQLAACRALRSLAVCSIGKAKAIESGVKEAVIDAVINHPVGSAPPDAVQCLALLFHIIEESKDNTELCISLGDGAENQNQVRKWPNNEDAQNWVRTLANWFGVEMKAWADEE